MSLSTEKLTQRLTEGLTRFVTATDDLVAEDGRILSWINPAKPGYPYDEITALYARGAAWLGRWTEATRLGLVVESRIAQRGLLERDEVGYAFDTSLAVPVLEAAEPVVERVLSMLTAGRACTSVQRPGWWSESVGAHQIKALAFLLGHGRDSLCRALADGLVQTCFDGSRFHIHEHSEATYLHSHCYAIEGLMLLDAHDDAVDAGAQWLATVQDEEGALPAWVGGQADARRPADVTAQALRIWAAVDPKRYAEPMRRALERLHALQDPSSGGLYYDSRSGDLNSWASLFALQASRWVQRTPDRRERKWLL